MSNKTLIKLRIRPNEMLFYLCSILDILEVLKSCFKTTGKNPSAKIHSEVGIKII